MILYVVSCFGVAIGHERQIIIIIETYLHLLTSLRNPQDTKNIRAIKYKLQLHILKATNVQHIILYISRLNHFQTPIRIVLHIFLTEASKGNRILG